MGPKPIDQVHLTLARSIKNRKNGSGKHASSAVQLVAAAMKVAYLENRSSMTIMEPDPSDRYRFSVT